MLGRPEGFRFLLVPILGAVAAAPVSAQAPAGAEFQVNSFTAGDQMFARPVMDSLGPITVVWQTRDALGARSVDGQLFTASGVRVGAEFKVNSSTYAVQPAVTTRKPSSSEPTKGDAAVVIWTGVQDIAGQKYAPWWRRQGGEFLVNSQTLHGQYAPDVASLPGGGFVVAWACSAFTVPGRIYARRFDANGNPLGGEVIASGTPTTDFFEGLPSVSSAGDGGFVVVWEHYTWGFNNVQARRFDPGGAPVGGVFEVTAPSGSFVGRPDVAVAEDGSFVVVWSASGGDGDQDGVRARMFTPDGLPAGPEFTVNEETQGMQNLAKVAAGPQGQFVVTWTSHAGISYDVVARGFHADGTPRSGDLRVNTYTTGDQIDSAVAADPMGNFVVVWRSAGQDGSGWGVFGQRFAGLVPMALDGSFVIRAR